MKNVLITCRVCGQNRLVNTNGVTKETYEKTKSRCRSCWAKQLGPNKTSFKKGQIPWNAGKAKPYFDKSLGYLKISNMGKKVKHHRFIMETKLGRKLNPKEIVHHVDNNKLNNNPDNLVIMTRTEHMKLHWKTTRRNYV